MGKTHLVCWGMKNCDLEEIIKTSIHCQRKWNIRTFYLWAKHRSVSLSQKNCQKNLLSKEESLSQNQSFSSNKSSWTHSFCHTLLWLWKIQLNDNCKSYYHVIFNLIQCHTYLFVNKDFLDFLMTIVSMRRSKLWLDLVGWLHWPTRQRQTINPQIIHSKHLTSILLASPVVMIKLATF